MSRYWVALMSVIALVAFACGPGGATTAPTRAPATGPGGSPAGPADTPGGPAGTPAGPAGTPATGPFDPATVTGRATLGQWESSPAERDALTGALGAFREAYPDLAVDQLTIAGDYRAEMITRFGARNPPDVFYINAEYARDWADEGFLLPLDDYIERQGIETEAFFPNYLDIFKGSDGQIYGLPKDGNTIALAHNTDLVATAPATLDELVSTAEGLVGQGNLTAPLCLSTGLDRALGFIYAQGGSLVTEDSSASAIQDAESVAAVQWYLDLFKNGLGYAAPSGSWCGQELGSGNAAIAFEGGWLLGFMDSTFPETNWAFAEMPTGSIGEKVTLSYTAAYGIGVDSLNKDQGWTVLQYLAGPDGMTKWTEGGIAVPSRSDVPVPEGFEVIVAGAEYSRPGSGFMTGYNDVQTAFQNAFVLEVQNGTFSAQPVVDATQAEIEEQLAE